MGTYRNEKYGFEIDLPDDWHITTGFARISFIISKYLERADILEEFTRDSKEFLNIVVETMIPEPPPDINELAFSLYALDRNYTDVEFGRIDVANRIHAWARYKMHSKAWLKKYLIVLNGKGYALTASCHEKYKHPESELTWDRIATSLRLLNPVDDFITEFNDSPQVRHNMELLRDSLQQQLKVRVHK